MPWNPNFQQHHKTTQQEIQYLPPPKPNCSSTPIQAITSISSLYYTPIFNMLYAGYYNLSQAEKESIATFSQARQVSSRRDSQESTSSATSTSSSTSQKIKSGLKKVLQEIRPTPEVLALGGIYAPVRGNPFAVKQSASSTSSKTELIKA